MSNVDWSEAEAVLREWLAQAERDLEDASGELHVGRCQGRLKTLKAVLVLPDVVSGRRATKEKTA